jgi:hypothetical protein
MTSIEVPYAIAAALPTLSVMDITNDVAKAVAAELAARGFSTLEEITVAREDVHFRLPRGLEAPAAKPPKPGQTHGEVARA